MDQTEENNIFYSVEVVNLDDFKGLKNEIVYIGRGGPLGNPFSDKHSKYDVVRVNSRACAIEKYEAFIREKIKYSCPESKAIEDCVCRLIKERKLVLGCFCKPRPCHGDILAKIIIELAKIREKERNIFQE